MYNSENPKRNEVGFKITSYILVLLTKTNKKLSSHGSSYNCMKIEKRFGTTCSIYFIRNLTLKLCKQVERLTQTQAQIYTY